MTAQNLSSGFSDAARDGACAFRAILIAMAHPGKTVTLGAACGPVPISPAATTTLLTLCDRTTPLYLAGAHDNPALREWIAFHCASPLVPAEKAAFALGSWEALQPITRFSIGTAEYPDRAATLIVDGHDFCAAHSCLTGPGLKDSGQLALPDPEVFAQNHALFPLGWDTILTSGTQLAALPRSTEIR